MSGKHLNVRIQFQKYGPMKFVGHLDIMRYFQKAIRRAGIAIAYSEGYSPHQLMSFAAPLGVGLTSDGEYFDIRVNAPSFGEEERKRLDNAMANGISILGFQVLPEMTKPSMSLVAAADYLIYVKPEYLEPGAAAGLPCQDSQGFGRAAGLGQETAGDISIFRDSRLLQEKVQAFYHGQESIPYAKQTKKNTMELDLKQLIYQMKAIDLKDAAAKESLSIKNPELLAILSEESAPAGKGGMLFLRLCTGSSSNLKPELALEAFFDFCGISCSLFHFQIHRLEVYAKAEEIPVKGERERKEYMERLKERKEAYAKEGRPFPEFVPLGEFGGMGCL